jgi:hypothetical protein
MRKATMRAPVMSPMIPPKREDAENDGQDSLGLAIDDPRSKRRKRDLGVDGQVNSARDDHDRLPKRCESERSGLLEDVLEVLD